jgi:hypothetical protein
MKAQFNVYLDVLLADKVKTTANHVGAPIGDLFGYLISKALEQVSQDEMEAWANGLQSRRGPLGGGMTKKERVCLATLKRLVQNSKEGAWRFDLREVAYETGLRPADALTGLKGLQTRNLVKGAEKQDKDNWGRPLESYWHMVDSEGEPITSV